MAVNVVDRIIGDPQVVPYLANQPQIQKIDRVSNLAYLRHRLTGTLTLASYTVAPTKLVESVENLIAQVMINATGKGRNAISEPIKLVDAAYLYFFTRILENTAPTRTDVGTANQAYNFETNFKTIFAHPPKHLAVAQLSPRELASLMLLDARTLSALNAQFTFRDQTALVTGGTGGTAVLSATQITTFCREVLGLPPLVRPFLKETQIPFNITQTLQGNLLKDLPVGKIIKRMIFKGMVGNNAYSDPSNAVFLNTTPVEGPHIKLRADGSYYPLDKTYQDIVNDNKELYALEAMPAGYAVWEPSGGFNARFAERLDALVDTNFTGGSTNTIQVSTQEVVVK